jgi:hypothetical protein
VKIAAVFDTGVLLSAIGWGGKPIVSPSEFLAIAALR